MKYINVLLDIRALRMALSLLVVSTLAVGCAQRPAYLDSLDEVPRGANRIILERENMTDALQEDTPALSFWVDARQHLVYNGYQIDVADDEGQILTTKPRMIDDNLAMRVMLKVQKAPAGSRLIVTSEYAPDLISDTWQPAAWTDGQARKAFEELFDLFSDLSNSDMAVATE